MREQILDQLASLTRQSATLTGEAYLEAYAKARELGRKLDELDLQSL